MNNYDFLNTEPKNQVLILVEGEFEKETIVETFLMYYKEINININNVHVFHTNIYELHRMIVNEYEDSWYEDDLEIDIPMLISKKNNIFPILDKRKFTNIILIFDYERQDSFFSEEVIMNLQKHFCDPSGDGILYINYPMIESFQHMNSIPDTGYYEKCISSNREVIKKYKKISANNSEIMKYIKISEHIRKKIMRVNGVNQERLLELILYSNVLKQDEICECLINSGYSTKAAIETSYELSSLISKFNFGANDSLMQTMRDKINMIVAQNMYKALKIQGLNVEQNDELKEMYYKIDFCKILMIQNKYSKNVGNIWVLCNCIIILGEYKFFWKEMEEKAYLLV